MKNIHIITKTPLQKKYAQLKLSKVVKSKVLIVF